jgi:isocitrate lyase
MERLSGLLCKWTFSGLPWPDSQTRRAVLAGTAALAMPTVLAYNCSPSFNWKKNLDDATIAKFQFITLPASTA